MTTYITQLLDTLPPLKTRPLAGRVSFARAVRLFDELAAMTEIPYASLSTGCFERADVMCDMMARAGYQPLKSWMVKGKNMLRFTAAKGEDICWHFHVAPALKVRMKDGYDAILVFDPALFDGPVSRQEWQNPMQMKATDAKPYLMPYRKSPPGFDRIRFPEESDDALWRRELENSLTYCQKLLRCGTERTVYQSALRRAFNTAAAPSDPPSKPNPYPVPTRVIVTGKKVLSR